MRYEIFSDNSASPLKIYSIGFSGDTTVTRFGTAKRNSYIVHYVTSGKGYYCGIPVTAGQGFLIYPGQSKEYHPDPSDPWEFLWILSTDDNMKELFDRYNADPDTLIFNYDTVPVVKKIENIITTTHSKIVDSLKLLEMFLQMLNSHTYTQFSSQCKPSSEIYLNFCVDFIETNIHEKITVGELSELTGVSQPYLYKIFKNKFNMSTKEYIVWHKIKRAKELLVETDISITEIANSVGYSDVLTFSKFFFSKEKVSPKKYRMLKKNTL